MFFSNLLYYIEYFHVTETLWIANCPAVFQLALLINAHPIPFSLSTFCFLCYICVSFNGKTEESLSPLQQIVFYFFISYFFSTALLYVFWLHMSQSVLLFVFVKEKLSCNYFFNQKGTFHIFFLLVYHIFSLFTFSNIWSLLSCIFKLSQ